jgi:predicted nucleic acid-binding protein
MTLNISVSIKDYKMGIETALIASAILSTGTAIAGQQQQRKAQSRARTEAEEAEEEARLEAERIAKATGPEQEGATITFGAGRRPGGGGGLEDFLIPRTGATSGLSTASRTGGLGFA